MPKFPHLFCPFCASDQNQSFDLINHQKRLLYQSQTDNDHMADETTSRDFKACLSDRHVEVIWHTHICKENSSEGESWDTCGDAGSITDSRVCWFAHARRRGGDSVEPSGSLSTSTVLKVWIKRGLGLGDIRERTTQGRKHNYTALCITGL